MSPKVRSAPVSILMTLICTLGAAGYRIEAGVDATVPLPNEWSSTVICGCEDAAEFTAGRTLVQPTFEFSAFDLSTTDKARVAGKSLRWHFRAQGQKQSWAQVAYCRSVTAPLDAISLWVKNPNGHALHLHLKVLDADGVWYLSPQQALGDDRNWRQLNFCLPDFTAATGQMDPRPGVHFPVIWIAAVVDPVAPGKPYTIYLDQLTGHQAPTGTAEIRELHAPTALAPGESAPVRVTVVFRHTPRNCDRLLVSFLVGAAPVAEAELVFDTDLDELTAGIPHTALAQGLKTPSWLPPGRYALEVSSPRLQLTGPAARPLAVAVAGASLEMHSVTIGSTPVPPHIKVGNELLPPVVGSVSGGSASEARRLADVGVRIVGIPATTDYHPFGWAQDVWTEPQALDFSGLDRRAAQVLNAHPDARLLMEVHMASPPWWDAEHPGEMQSFGDTVVAPTAMMGRKRTYPDLTSTEWAQGVEVRLGRLVEHIEGAPYGHRVVGYELRSGDLGTWRPWGTELGLAGGPSELQQKAFREWLMRRYGGIEALRVAWGGPRQFIGVPGTSNEGGLAAWDEVTIPTRARRDGGREPTLYDPATEPAPIDLAHFRAEAPVDLMLEMARTVKAACGGRKLVGACYGHLLGQATSAQTWRWPHLAISRVLGDDRVDFLSGPLWTAGPSALPAFPVASARANGKLWLERVPPDASPSEIARSAAVALASGAGIAVPAHGLQHVQWLPPALERMLEAEEELLQAPAQLGVVMDDVSALYLSHSGGLATPLFAAQERQLRLSGIPCRVYMLNDVIEGRVPAARMYLFLDAFKFDRQRRISLREQVCRDKQTLVWVYAPGAIGKMIGGRTMKDLTGIALTLVTSPGALKVRVGEESPLLGEELTKGFTYGAGEGMPRFFCAQEGAQRLGDLAGSDFAGLVVREFDDHTSVFSAAPALPMALLRALARRAGLPIYLQDDGRAWFGTSVIALEGTAAGSRSLHLPAPATLTDLITGETLATGTRDIRISLGERDIGAYTVKYQERSGQSQRDGMNVSWGSRD